MTEPRWDGKVASEVFRKLRSISGDIIRDTHSLRDTARDLAATARLESNATLAQTADELVALANVIDSDTFNLHELHTLLALLDLAEVRQRLGVPYQATHKPKKAAPTRRETGAESVTQDLRRVDTK